MKIICVFCGSELFKQTYYSAWSHKKNRRVMLCRDCLGEVEFGILPKVTGPTKDTPMGGPGQSHDPSPWQENAVRNLEGD